MPNPCSGILEIDQKGNGHLRAPGLGIPVSPGDAAVMPDMIQRFNLRPGVTIEGMSEAFNGNSRGKSRGKHRGNSPRLASVASVNGMPPEAWREVREFSAHEVVSPTEWMRLEGPANDPAMRVVDLFCPVGRGQRALIVSPPKAGKTMLLQQIAHAVGANHADVDVAILLVDERPEEVTDIRRTVKGEVFASTSDTDRSIQVRLAVLVLEYVKRKVETGRDVVLLLDSLTRLGRAFNIHQKGTGRTLSGGVDVRALEIPKRIFGAARKLEGHGSLSIIATALIETNSRMDELIFQEFKGTGNMELVLDRALADERIFPAINLSLSGTRREELLFGPEVERHQLLRRMLVRLTPKEAMIKTRELMRRHRTNDELLKNLEP